jgi:hypothetical protein
MADDQEAPKPFADMLKELADAIANHPAVAKRRAAEEALREAPAPSRDFQEALAAHKQEIADLVAEHNKANGLGESGAGYRKRAGQPLEVDIPRGPPLPNGLAGRDRDVLDSSVPETSYDGSRRAVSSPLAEKDTHTESWASALT